VGLDRNCCFVLVKASQYCDETETENNDTAWEYAISNAHHGHGRMHGGDTVLQKVFHPPRKSSRFFKHGKPERFWPHPVGSFFFTTTKSTVSIGIVARAVFPHFSIRVSMAYSAPLAAEQGCRIFPGMALDILVKP